MEHSDFEPTQPEFMPTEPESAYIEQDEMIVDRSEADFMAEMEEHKRSLQVLKEKSEDMSLSKEERKEFGRRWIEQKVDFEEKEYLLGKGKVIFRGK